MEDLIWGLLSEAADFAIDAIGAFVAGAAVAYFAYKVTEKITESNIVEHIREFIRREMTDDVKKKLGEHIIATIKDKNSNVVTVSISTLDDNKPLAEVKIESESGIDGSILTGKKFKIPPIAA